METILTYIPIDNSYSQCIDDNGINHYPAGTNIKLDPIKLNVLIQPFDMIVKPFKTERVHKFIIGLDEITGLRHLVLYV